MPTNKFLEKETNRTDDDEEQQQKKARIYISLLRFGIRDGNKPK